MYGPIVNQSSMQEFRSQALPRSAAAGMQVYLVGIWVFGFTAAAIANLLQQIR